MTPEEAAIFNHNVNVTIEAENTLYNNLITVYELLCNMNLWFTFTFVMICCLLIALEKRINALDDRITELEDDDELKRPLLKT